MISIYVCCAVSPSEHRLKGKIPQKIKSFGLISTSETLDAIISKRQSCALYINAQLKRRTTELMGL